MAAPPCLDQLAKLHDAIISLAAGERAVTVSFGERSATYAQGQLKDLKQLFGMYYRQCGADSGYPDLANPIERGPPARF